MKTYLTKLVKRYRYYYDTNIKLWTIYQVDNLGNQVDLPDYYNDRDQLQKAYPFLNFNLE